MIFLEYIGSRASLSAWKFRKVNALRIFFVFTVKNKDFTCMGNEGRIIPEKRTRVLF